MADYSSDYDQSMAPDDLKYVIYEKKDHVAYVTLNRPEVRNALHTWAYQELRRCWTDIQLDPNIYCGIVTGAGQAFCAGRDIKFLAEYQSKGLRTPHEDPTSPHYQWGGGGQPQDSILNKPLIAAINGFAVGVGISIALQCQLRVMADDAWLGDQHTAVGRLGNPHEIYCELPRTAAAFITLCNGRITAEDAYRQAIVNKVVPRQDLIASAEEYAHLICRNSPLATQGVVRVYNLVKDFSPALKAFAADLDRQIGESDDMAEAAAAFVEKRRPHWKMK
ncbi:MAG: enoyl-CoA hydratase/isomerase family protein [Bifidobacteriaceae bacterium]|jgi:enoyl-CoA hydratase/carnithine racemase|nr:enoyl-CoA hydratase/isomerase family protein [Bifidobacteriaceae bacterium]